MIKNKPDLTNNKLEATSLSHNQTIKASRKMVNQIKHIAVEEERNIQTITNRILKLGLEAYSKKYSSS